MTDLTRDDIARAMKLPGWKWMNGMLLHYGGSGLRIDRFRLGGEYDDDPQRPIKGSPWLPDPSDPATAGCLLELLGPGADTCSCGGAWDVTIVDRDVTGSSTESLGAACARAALALGEWPGGAA